eukprot:TRINITY_DN27807_c0_g3_i1.p1 TRINITY_DN27807_c0_g3~~TRINITY_DN27807_c0_g3_i1.p1  ORF type:complete len:348 (+),score=18.07 TRINITY_DN27807_c0_g3_i1:86-1045(+)
MEYSRDAPGIGQSGRRRNQSAETVRDGRASGRSARRDSQTMESLSNPDAIGGCSPSDPQNMDSIGDASTNGQSLPLAYGAMESPCDVAATGGSSHRDISSIGRLLPCADAYGQLHGNDANAIAMGRSPTARRTVTTEVLDPASQTVETTEVVDEFASPLHGHNVVYDGLGGRDYSMQAGMQAGEFGLGGNLVGHMNGYVVDPHVDHVVVDEGAHAVLHPGHDLDVYSGADVAEGVYDHVQYMHQPDIGAHFIRNVGLHETAGSQVDGEMADAHADHASDHGIVSQKDVPDNLAAQSDRKPPYPGMTKGSRIPRGVLRKG